MAQFIITHDLIDASQRRVVAIWFGDVDRLALQEDSNFTGSAILVAIYSLSAAYQYYVVFVALDHHVEEIWRIEPEFVPLSDAPITQSDILKDLKDKGIVLTYLSSESRHYQRILSMLPFAFDDNNNSSNFVPPGKMKSLDGLSDDEKKILRDWFVHF